MSSFCRIVRDFEVVAQGGTDVTERIGNPSTLNPSNILSGPQAAEVRKEIRKII
jgi:hypothetical protein